jgi:murein DD-endopeptidase MepM/ murein hydrolase activator NlpD
MHAVQSRVFGFVLTLITVFLLVTSQATASSVSYKVTDGFTITTPDPHGVGRVFFFKNLQIPFSAGKMILSSTPDGTGSARIGDLIQVIAGYPGSGTYTYRAKPDCINGSSILPPTDVTSLFFTNIFDSNINNIAVRFSDWCEGPKYISPIYLVNIDTSDQPIPFLDLPWDYSGKGLSFTDAALQINSYFDHEYPLLSTGLSEGVIAADTVFAYSDSSRGDKKYSSHDGYDYGSPAKVSYKDPVLAAASGWAEYKNNCGACGNQIQIDHGNRFQTRYFHMMFDDLIASVPGQRVWVNKGQMIGRVGFTGNVHPKGENGAHIHFMVVQDKNYDGNFDDNIPDGLVDPYGWQSEDHDPWEIYSFNYLGQQRTGNKSYYLWTQKIDSLNTAIPSNGGTVTSGAYSLDFPANVNGGQEFELYLQGITVSLPPPNLGVIGSGEEIIAKDILGNPLTAFLNFFTLQYDFSSIDMSRYKADSIFFYSSSDGANWTKETGTAVDLSSKKATLQLGHMTMFALMAELKDTIAPLTTMLVHDATVQPSYQSDVTVTLRASDNDGGSGIDYVAYKVDDGEWKEYVAPFVVTEEGNHTVSFYAVDKDGNIEDERSINFIVEKNKDLTPPEIGIQLDSQTKEFIYAATDSSGSASLTKDSLDTTHEDILATDEAQNRLLATVEKHKNKFLLLNSMTLRVNSLQYNEDQSTNLDSNLFTVLYTLDSKNKFTFLTQAFASKIYGDVLLVYDTRRNKTTIVEKIGKKIITKTVAGMRILQLFTQSGTLRYRY